jgi:hypothetical protein
MEVTQVEELAPEKFGIEPTKATELMGNLPVVKQERELLISEFNEVVTLNIDDKTTSKRAGELRKRIAKNRTQGIMEWHKRAKEFFLRGGQFVDAIKRVEVSINEKMEEVLEAIEKHQENLEKQRKAELREARLSEIQKYNGTEPVGLSEMDENQFQTYLSGVKYQFEQAEKARIEAEEKQRKDALHNDRKTRLARYADFIPGFDSAYFGEISEDDFVKVGTDAKAKKDAYDAEQERLRQEAEKARKEAEEAQRLAREAQLKAEAEARKAQEEAQAKLRAEQEARRKAEQESLRKQQEAEAEARKLREAEDARLKAEADAKAKAEQEAQELAQKSDNDRLVAWIESFSIPAIPQGKYTKKSQTTIEEIQLKFEAFKNWAELQTK